ncbi:uncharacterized protein (UPF0332 family) [Catenuloplanes nepalensis]|uniref:Uncharacterized protein (UPF0332 family) n=1 Tax=Catenuloplanes nepalensis TaxID=587533 RepID=A0ABT9MLY7_9ACTN|nr:hypothetical protein [Catenuloplanes nepalensis]MDP9792440.1 uncharacterized protein (UPF0332 family) [Catenuloplanes nepalensis]
MFTWRLLLRIAFRMLNSTQAEPEHRSAINRAYYAALGEAREYAKMHGLSMVSQRSSHEQVWQYLRAGKSSSHIGHRAAAKAIGDMGITLRSLRVQADYFINQPPTEEDAKRSVSMAEQIIRRIHSLP